MIPGQAHNHLLCFCNHSEFTALDVAFAEPIRVLSIGFQSKQVVFSGSLGNLTAPRDLCVCGLGIFLQEILSWARTEGCFPYLGKYNVLFTTFACVKNIEASLISVCSRGNPLQNRHHIMFVPRGIPACSSPSTVMSWIWIDVGFSLLCAFFLAILSRTCLVLASQVRGGGRNLSDVFMDSCQYSYSQRL